MEISRKTFQPHIHKYECLSSVYAGEWAHTRTHAYEKYLDLSVTHSSHIIFRVLYNFDGRIHIVIKRDRNNFLFFT